jgi:hypothetical protein
MHGKLPPFIVAVAAVVLSLFATTATAGDEPPDSWVLALYEPVLQFDPLEQFTPTKVQSFIRDTDLEQLTATGDWVVATRHPEPGDLPGVGSGVWRLNQETCTPASPVGGLACYADAQRSASSAVYGRVAHENDDVVLQYWFFYYDDVYSYVYPPNDFVWQAHEGDWESVTVVLSADRQPLFVGYSQHCLGEQRAWGATPRLDDTHPLVHVALGSHANYFSTGTHPINAACIPPAAVGILQRNHLPLPVDYTFAGATAAAIPIHRLDDDRPDWIGFPGFWGELQYFHAPAPIGTVAFGTSPLGPAFHREWTDPLGTLAGWPSA